MCLSFSALFMKYLEDRNHNNSYFIALRNLQGAFTNISSFYTSANKGEGSYYPRFMEGERRNKLYFVVSRESHEDEGCYRRVGLRLRNLPWAGNWINTSNPTGEWTAPKSTPNLTFGQLGLAPRVQDRADDDGASQLLVLIPCWIRCWTLYMLYFVNLHTALWVLTMLPPLYRWRNWSSERFSNSLKVTQLVTPDCLILDFTFNNSAVRWTAQLVQPFSQRKKSYGVCAFVFSLPRELLDFCCGLYQVRNVRCASLKAFLHSAQDS